MRKVLEAILDINILSPPKEYISSILQAICDYFGYACGSALTVTPSGDMAVFAEYGLPSTVLEQLALDAAAGSFAPSRQAQTDLSIRSVQYPQDELGDGSWRLLRDTCGVQAITRVPILYQQQLFGMYYLFAVQPHPVTDDEFPVLTQIGEMASVAIASNRYLEQLNQRTKELHEEILVRKRMETTLREALRERKVLEDIVSRSPVVVFLWRATPEMPVEFVSKNIEQFGYTQDDLYSGAVSLYDLIHPEDVEQVRADMARHVGSGSDEFVLEYRIITKEGKMRWVENRMWLCRDTDGTDIVHVVTTPRNVVTHLRGLLHDITERKRAEETVRHQAYHDILTGLPNRSLFDDRLTLALAHARRHQKKLAVMFLDLDRFKYVNDTLGHATGDMLLKGVSERLKARLREEDTISRMGGDEFTILLPEVEEQEDVANVAQKVLDALNTSFMLGRHEVFVTTSIGISLYPRDGRDAQTLLQNADTALYHAKEHGRNTFQFYHQQMMATTLERVALESSLHTALERNEFIVHYQPQVDISTGQMIGMESLVRWQHPERGVVSPAQFIPLAEETGLIEPIGEWVLRTTCRQSKAWIDAGFLPLKVAVNLSARQFHQENLTSMIASVLEETQLNPQCLELEITESVAMRDVDYSVSMMRRLKDMGIHLSMDDFGVGYSSLIHLKKFPINTLKIDQCFIRGLTMDPNDQAIATAIIAMARSLNLKVIAEGVETDEQLSFLREHQCDGMQGYLFSKPLPSDAFSQLLRFLAL